MLALELLAERKIAEAIERGEFDDLPGAGKPLELEDDPLVPEELRMAYRILRNAGYRVSDSPAEEARERAKAARKLELLRLKLEPRYYGKVIAKLTR
jgi:Domain of unknown function (DUF1992)